MKVKMFNINGVLVDEVECVSKNTIRTLKALISVAKENGYVFTEEDAYCIEVENSYSREGVNIYGK